MKSIKRILCVCTAVLCLLGCLTGCGEGVTIVAEPAPTEPARGRYVETEISLPECQYAEDLVMLSTGQLRVSYRLEDGSAAFSTTGPDLETWEQTMELPTEILDSGAVANITLSPKGSVFCHTIGDADEDGSHAYHFWVIDPDGSFREIPITYPDADPQRGFLAYYCDFTDSGVLMAQFHADAFCSVDLVTGQLGENVNELERAILKSSCAGEDCIMLGWDTASMHSQGKTEALTGVFGEQVLESLRATESMSPRLNFWKNAEGYLFYTTQDGLYSYIPGGGVVEELVSGARSSLGDPSFLPIALTGDDSGSFYVLGSRNSDSNFLYRYVYDENAPTVAENHLRIFSLYQDDGLQQMVSQYQIAHPEVAIDLEIGMTGDSGIQESDAIRTLNTEILAGRGPDLICLDGFNLDAYLEKGVLADLSGMLSRAEPRLTQVTDCYASDGAVCAIPTTFAIPAMYGPGHIVSQIQDLDSLAASASQAGQERPETVGILTGMLPVQTADMFYDSCSAAWKNPDGTLNGEKLTQFYAGMQQIFAVDAPMREELAEFIHQLREEQGWYVPGEYTGLSSSSSLLSDYCLSFGTLDGMWQWAFVLMADDLLPGYETRPLSLQGTGGVFLPRRIMGMLSGSANPQAAEDFLIYMLSQEVQAECLSTGFPVNQAAFEKELSEDRVIDSWYSSSDAEGNVVSFQSQYPDARCRAELRSWVDSLTTPALTDRTIRTLVMEQMDACLYGEITPQEAAQNALKSLNLYLSE